MLVANYGSGSSLALPIDADGRLGPSSSFIQHKGTGSDPGGRRGRTLTRSISTRRAASPWRPTWGWTRSSSTGSTTLKGTLAPNDPPFAEVAPESGPRHFAFHPDGRFGYVISEMANTRDGICVRRCRGSLSEIQTISTLPADFLGKSYTAEVQVHPSGKFVYGSNRGHDSIAIFAVDPRQESSARSALSPRRAKTRAISPSIRPGAYLAGREWRFGHDRGVSASMRRAACSGPPARASAFPSRFASR